jgi:hypothetical protein
MLLRAYILWPLWNVSQTPSMWPVSCSLRGFGELTCLMLVLCAPSIPKAFSGAGWPGIYEMSRSVLSWASLRTRSKTTLSATSGKGSSAAPSNAYCTVDVGSQICLAEMGSGGDALVGGLRLDSGIIRATNSVSANVSAFSSDHGQGSYQPQTWNQH